MKHLVFLPAAIFLSLPAFASNNNIKMVTYFPIPYVSYNELGVTKTCDLGLMDGCVLDSGSSLRVQKSTSDGALRLKEGTLSLSGPGVTGNRFVAGTNTISNSRIGFKHSVDVKSMTQAVQSLEATNRAYLGELNLFGESFPKCENNNSREMTWKRLTINGKDGVFFVCGNAAEQPAPCSGKYTCKYTKGASSGTKYCTDSTINLFAAETEICSASDISCVYKTHYDNWTDSYNSIQNPCQGSEMNTGAYTCPSSETGDCEDADAYIFLPRVSGDGTCTLGNQYGYENCLPGDGKKWCPRGSPSSGGTPPSQDEMCRQFYNLWYASAVPQPNSVQCQYVTTEYSGVYSYAKLTCHIGRRVRMARCVSKSDEATVTCTKG